MSPALGNGPGTVVVDGNNVIGARADGWWRDRPAAVRRLLARVQCYGARTGRPVVLVLDVPQADLPEGDHEGVVVRYPRSGGRGAADRRILELLDGEDAGAVEVVTSDRELIEATRRRGAGSLGAGAFLNQLDEAGC